MMVMMITTQMRRLMDTMNTSMERVASMTTVPRATNMVRMDTMIITSMTTVVTSIITVVTSTIMVTSMTTNMIISMVTLMTINMASLRLQSCLSRRGRRRRKRNLTRH